MNSCIIILNYNDGKRAANLALTLSAYKTPTHIILVDNCSADDSFQLMSRLTEDRDNIHVIQTDENGGYAKGNNFGIRYALAHFSPDYVFVANPDIMVSESAMNALLAAMDTNPQYGAMSCLVNQGYNVWRLPGFIGMVESLFLIWFNLDKRSIKKRLAASEHAIATVGVVEGSFFCLRAEAYSRCDGFDERTFLYVEENILARRLKNAGYLEGVLTRERYDHFHSVSIKKEYKSSKARAFHLFYNSMKLYNHAYLHTNPLQNGLFEVCYFLAYLERVLYDFIQHFR